LVQIKDAICRTQQESLPINVLLFQLKGMNRDIDDKMASLKGEDQIKIVVMVAISTPRNPRNQIGGQFLI